MTIATIDRSLLDAEAGLMRRKWFDYRAMHPLEATYLMVHHYNRAYGDFIGEALDYTRRFTKVIKGTDFMGHLEVKSFWRLRQKIDELGMRYEFFLRAAMNYLIERGWGKGQPHPPRPAHILRDDELVLAVSNAWARECRSKTQFATDPHYLAVNWCGSPDQLDYQQHLIDAIHRRPHKRFALSAAVHLYGQLRIEAAIEHFPDDVADAIDFSLQNH